MSKIIEYQNLSDGFRDLEYREILPAVQRLVAGLNKDEILQLAKDAKIHGVYSRVSAVAELARAIDTRKGSWDRTRFRE